MIFPYPGHRIVHWLATPGSPRDEYRPIRDAGLSRYRRRSSPRPQPRPALLLAAVPRAASRDGGGEGGLLDLYLQDRVKGGCGWDVDSAIQDPNISER